VALDPDPAGLTAQVPGAGPAAGEIVAQALADLSRAQVTVVEFTLGQPSLDEVFLALTGRPAAGDASPKDDASPKEKPA
jgi:ABC-2 type transport system ATP-binding protein